MTLSNGQLLVAGWLAAASLAAFVLFGYDKWQAGRSGGRVAESTLWLWCALGGWPGGLLGILIFHHKSAKASFQFKFAAAFAVWASLLWGAWRLEGKFRNRSVSLAGAETWSRSDTAAVIDQSAARSPQLQAIPGPAGLTPCV